MAIGFHFCFLDDETTSLIISAAAESNFGRKLNISLYSFSFFANGDCSLRFWSRPIKKLNSRVEYFALSFVQSLVIYPSPSVINNTSALRQVFAPDFFIMAI